MFWRKFSVENINPDMPALDENPRNAQDKGKRIRIDYCLLQANIAIRKKVAQDDYQKGEADSWDEA